MVVGVEYRNGGGVLGAHPFPAGLDDCVAGLRWTHEHLAELGGTHVVLTGDSGGANLCLGLAIRAKREGWVDRIAGVHALCPYVLGAWDRPPSELASLWENNGHVEDPTCWAARAGLDVYAAAVDTVVSFARRVAP